MMRDNRLQSERFPRSSKYHPDWLIANSMGSNVLWLTEWLTSAMALTPGMRVLDLGCGRAASSIFLAREFGVQVWGVDLWIPASENALRIADADLIDQVYPLHADARALPFAANFFDAILSVDSFSYFGTDSLYLNYLANFVKPGGKLGMAGAGLMQEFDVVPDHLRDFWTQDFWCLHSTDWWRRLWERTGIVKVEVADRMVDGWQSWIDWQSTAFPDNNLEIETLDADRGDYLGYVRMVATKQADVQLENYCWPDGLRSFPPHYEQQPLLRNE